MPDIGDINVKLGLDASGLGHMLDEAVSDVKQAAGSMATAFSGVNESVAGAGKSIVDSFQQASSAGQEFQKELQSTLQSLGADLRTVGTDLTVAVTVPLTAMAAAAVAASLDIQAAMNTLRQTTDGLGPELDSLKKSFNEVFANVPAKAADVANALAMLNDRLGITGSEMTKVATQFLNLARITGEQVVPLITSATQAFAAWGVSTDQLAGKLDYVRNVANATGTKVGELLNQVKTFAPALQELGYNFDQATAMIAKFDKEGLNVSRVLGGLRIALNNLSKAGIQEPVEGLRVLIDMIKEAGSVSEANAIGLKAFGRGAQDMVLAIRSGKLDIEDFVKEMQGASDTINKAAADTLTFAQKFQLFKNSIEQTLGPLGDSLTRIAGQIIDAITPLMKWVEELVRGFAALPEPVQIAVVALAALAAVLGPLIVTVGLFMQAWAALIPIAATAAAALGSAGLAGAITVLGTALGVIGAIGIGKQIADLWFAAEGRVRAFQVALKDTTTSGADFQKQMQNSLTAVAKDAAGIKTSFDTSAQSIEEVRNKILGLVNGYEKAGAAMRGVSTEQILLAQSAKKAWAEQKELQKIIDYVNQTLKINAELDKQIADYQSGISSSISGQAALWMVLKDNIEDVNSAFNEQMRVADQATSYNKKWAADLMNILDRLPGGFKAAQDAVAETTRDFQNLGLTFKQSVETQIDSYNRLMSAGMLTAKQALTAQKAILEQEIENQKQAGDAISQIYLDRLHEVQNALKKFGNDELWKDIDNQVNKLANDFSEGFANALISGKGFVEEMSKAFKKLGEDFVKFVVQEFLKASGILDNLKKQLSSILGDIFGKAKTSAGGAVPGLPKLPTPGGSTGGASMSQPGQVIGMNEDGTPIMGQDYSGGMSSGAGGAGEGAGGLLSGISGIVGAITGVISAVSGIISNFQLAHMNTNIGRIEESTRRLDIYTEQMFPIFHMDFGNIRAAVIEAGVLVGSKLDQMKDAFNGMLGTDSETGLFGGLTRVAASLQALIAALSSVSSPNNTGGAPGAPDGPKKPLDGGMALELTALNTIHEDLTIGFGDSKNLLADLVKSVDAGVRTLNNGLYALGSSMAMGAGLTAVAAAGGGGSGGLSIGNLNITDPNAVRLGQQLIGILQAKGLKTY